MTGKGERSGGRHVTNVAQLGIRTGDVAVGTKACICDASRPLSRQAPHYLSISNWLYLYNSPTSCAGASRGFLNSARETGSENFANMEGRS